MDDDIDFDPIDLFAGFAIMGLLAHGTHINNPQETARLAYEHADALHALKQHRETEKSK